MGDFLTTLGNTPAQDREMFEAQGLDIARDPDKRREPATRQPLRPPRRGDAGIVEEFLDDYTPSGDIDLSVQLWDPSSQLRYRARESRCRRPDGAPNRWPEAPLPTGARRPEARP